jgi:type IV pilus assembly protein PilN
MDHVSQSLEPLKLWLVRVGVTGQNIDIEGRALTNDDVVEFVNNLRRTDYFMDINLLESRAAVESQVSLYQYKLGFRLKG